MAASGMEAQFREMVQNALNMEGQAVDLENDGNVNGAIVGYERAHEAFHQAVTFQPAHEDAPAIRRHQDDLISRVTYLKSDRNGFRGPPSDHIRPVTFSFYTNVVKRRRDVLMEEAGQVKNSISEGAANLDQKYDISGKAQRGTSVAQNKVTEIDQKYDVSGKAREFSSAAKERASEINKEYRVSEKAQAGAQVAADKAQEVANAASLKAAQLDQEYKIMEKAQDAAASAATGIAGWWYSQQQNDPKNDPNV